MIDDIVFDEIPFIMEIPYGNVGGIILSYSLDGINYDFTSIIVNPTIISNEHSYTFIN